MANSIVGEKRVGDIQLRTKNGMLIVDETYEYLILTDDAAASRQTVLANTPNLPIPYQTMSPSGMTVCKSLSLKRDEKATRYWHGVANFSSEVEESSTQGGTNSEDPTTWVPIRETILEPYTTVKHRGVDFQPLQVPDPFGDPSGIPNNGNVWVDGKPFVNGLGIPLNNFPEVPRDNLRWDFFQFDKATVPDQVIAFINNSINMYEFLKCPPHTLKLTVRSSKIGFFYGVRCRVTELSLIYKADNWHHRYANQGNTFLGNDGKIYPYKWQGQEEIVIGPLGTRNVKYDQDIVQSLDGVPLGGSTVDGAVQKAVKPSTTTNLFTIERMIYHQLDFKKFLRVR